MEQKLALVVGAAGGIGSEVCRVLQAHGWAVRGLARDPGRVRDRDGVDWRRGDAMSADDVREAARGAALIVHAVNPPGYRNWGTLVLPMLENTIAAAKAERARILLPGTVYNYGPDAFPLIDEAAAQKPLTAKGRIRAEMERRLKADADAGDVRVLIVRAGDYFGPSARNNWFSMGLVKAGKPVGSVTYPGAKGVGHQWAYLPDVAETMARLADRDDLAPFETFHMEGHWDQDGTAMVAAVRRAVAKPALPVRALPWGLMRLASPVVPLFRELAEMRYLWQRPVRLTNAKLVRLLGTEPHTPLDEAVRTTLAGLGCLPASRKGEPRDAQAFLTEASS